MNSCIPESSSFDSLKQHCQENICIVLLVGIPGSGKSSFRVFLENYFKTSSKTILGTVRVVSICYDDFCKVRNPIQFSDSVKWKEDRKEIFIKTEQIIKNLKMFNLENCEILLENIRVINSEIMCPDTVLFIIDDNMYYRSMRYEYYKLSRSYNLGFCEFFFNATLQEALQCNKRRESHSQVPDFVIENMFEKLEPPDESLSWEKYVLFLTPYLDFEEGGVLDIILSKINSALNHPVQQSYLGENKEEAQQINKSNAIHQIDIVLKQLVGDLIKRRIKESSDSPRTVSQYFSEKRFAILKEIKDGTIVLPIDLGLPINEQDIEVIKPVLSECLHTL